jgi:hypothetical protein
LAVTWEYTETAPAPTLRAALDAAQSGLWTGQDRVTRARHVRALAVGTLAAGRLAGLGGLSTTTPEGTTISLGSYAVKDFADKAHLDVAVTVLRTPFFWLDHKPIAVRSCRSTDGEPAELFGESQNMEAGVAPFVLVLGAAFIALAVIAVAELVSDVIDRQNARLEDTKRLLAAQAKAVEIVTAHRSAEVTAGKALPYNEGELAIVRALGETQSQIAQKEKRPMTKPFSGASEGLGNLLSGAGSALDKTGSGLELLLPIGGAVAIALAMS